MDLLEKQLSTVYFKDFRFPWVTLYIYKLLHKKARTWVWLDCTLSVLLSLWIFHDDCSAHDIISSSIMPKEE